MTSSRSILGPELIERILFRLGLSKRPTLDLVGLNTLYAAWCGHVPFDNVHKRIWFASDHTTPLTGGDPVQFLENWLAYGTGGTCWPTGSAMYALVQSLGFDARRMAGAMIDPGEQAPDPAGHGSVLVTFEGVDHLVDASILAFEVLPLVPGVPATAGQGIHEIHGVPIEGGFEVLWHPGHVRDAPTTFRTGPEFDPVDQAFFLEGYDRSRVSGPFNSALHVCRRYPGSVITLRRNRKTIVAGDGSVSVTQISDAERTRTLIEELGFSEEIVRALPRDEPERNASS